ncbi:hypothetical protein H5410_051533 [Solanum commersonii]|uniref:Uncharacterized protein n=1 Tax=Solanum commersonii TaxID=4109 RepID=A0A9J5WYQ2_SOLCO|nr:hypothetical protein H5410_051533 [Solanum commersonii]
MTELKLWIGGHPVTESDDVNPVDDNTIAGDGEGDTALMAVDFTTNMVRRTRPRCSVALFWHTGSMMRLPAWRDSGALPQSLTDTPTSQNKKLKLIKGVRWRIVEPFAPEIKIKLPTFAIRQVPVDPCLRGTQNSPELAKFGHLTTFTLKNDVNRSIIRKVTSYGTIGGFLDFTPTRPNINELQPNNL